jgi:hypothetical protein|tara:strand:- start:1984 stop:2316 length:333 start_codon:yes stop_codon:yes gene_type:complete
MKNVRAIRHSVLGFFVNPPGEGKTKGGLITLDDDGKSTGIKTRFFEVHDVGNDNVVTHDVKKGDIVAVAHGRWSRGFDIDHPEGKKLYSLDPKDIMGIWTGDIEAVQWSN